MLQANTARVPAPQEERATSRELSLRSLRTALRRSVTTIGVTVVVCLAAAALFCWLSVPTYVSTVQLLIEPQKQQQLLWFEPGMLDLTLDNAQVESQVELLRSERLAADVVAGLNLQQDPEFVPRDAPAKDEGKAETRGETKTEGAADLGADPAAESTRRLRTTVAALGKRVGVRRVGQSYVIEVSAWAYRPDLAAAIANTYADAYLRDQYSAKSNSARQGVDWLRARIVELRGTLNEAARAVETFKTRNDLVTAGDSLLIEQQLSEMNSQLVTARAQTMQAAARLERVGVVGREAAGSAAVGEALNNPVITNLRQRQQDAVQREAELRERYGPDHEAVVTAHREVVQIEAEVATEMKRIGQTYLSDYEVARGRERALKAELRTLIGEIEQRRQAKVTLSELEAQAESYRKMYQNLLEKLTETAQKETLPVSSARIVTKAMVPLDRSSPRTKLILALGGAFGLLGGLMIAAARSHLDRSVRDPADLEGEAGIECLGMIPLVKGAGPGPLGFEVIERPFSAFSRALRGVKIRIDTACEGRVTQTVGVASIATGEGKSSVALNLAALYAQANCRTLLIDADFLDAALTRVHAPAAAAGFLEMLREGRDMTRPTGVQNLALLPLVTKDRLPNSSDVLGSRQMHALLAELAASYDVVVLDLTAMREAMDVRAVCRLLDGLVLVTAWGETEAGALAEAAASIDGAQAHLFGAILNKARDLAAVSRSI
ncbi:GumC family protein [Methylobacterium symbioticum]|uniref:Tyrosine-protein kinase YwqD n=1 Tax=Methylobacterium symbioticum TaxID=2584084 RepID=A0A509E8X7_9HYPH|nr:GNVR domain-containing protein [Methylobacterium symbioticum]VUD70124.1 Tyrosine-protein kinase YwqD [Methylobacterium symbioticum]